jgi:hypothetical protein
VIIVVLNASSLRAAEILFYTNRLRPDALQEAFDDKAFAL